MTTLPVRLIRGDQPLPDPEQADARGLVAIGGDLRPARLLDAYRRGIFPWYGEGLPILWHSPDPRFVLEPGALRVNRSLRKSVRRHRYRLSFEPWFLLGAFCFLDFLVCWGRSLFTRKPAPSQA